MNCFYYIIAVDDIYEKPFELVKTSIQMAFCSFVKSSLITI